MTEKEWKDFENDAIIRMTMFPETRVSKAIIAAYKELKERRENDWPDHKIAYAADVLGRTFDEMKTAIDAAREGKG